MRFTPAARSFVAGLLVSNSAPHLATAVTGHRHFTPLAGRRSGPGINLLWGAANLAGGLALLRSSARAGRPGEEWDGRLVAFEGGCLVFAAWMAVSERFFPMNHGES
ncbi:hypothetical protein [Nonomuraea gerenzanensis]|uniref:hypothetical protein n=1 Tax=Nonomuraea gerenzanensis TaxID=93944 RepID=UPI001CD94660|nr:hypothetical protein [Nonomuraea gerenzanensis]UBU17653.1 hypothetical protein LCN96_22300 [Nonomuraea gerenzanensis]